jgi:hypothetical protein
MNSLAWQVMHTYTQLIHTHTQTNAHCHTHAHTNSYKISLPVCDVYVCQWIFTHIPRIFESLDKALEALFSVLRSVLRTLDKCFERSGGILLSRQRQTRFCAWSFKMRFWPYNLHLNFGLVVRFVISIFNIRNIKSHYQRKYKSNQFVICSLLNGLVSHVMWDCSVAYDS